ncbi:MAG: carbohydrate ABC transporter substrate-binding protein [Bacillaceae bacterium]|nr:carbohydrate ABC transporter substrate-binding protein [Bacillaceae bacterium]
MKPVRKSLLAVLSFALIFVLAFTACSNQDEAVDQQPAENETDQQEQPVADDSENKGSYLERAYAGEFQGTKVSVFGPFADADEVKFEQSIKPFEEKTGIDIQYESSKEFEATISIRVEGGNAPDIADFPQPGLLESFVKTGKVIDVRTFLDEDYLKEQYNQSWLDMATMEGPDGDVMAGVWSRSNLKSLVWYPKNEFEAAGYEVPETWDELLALSEQIAADGDTPWAIGIESGAATGWVATDWVEDIMLRTTSPENYDKWVKGELPFTSDIVKNAVQEMSKIWLNDDYVYGGRKAIVTTPFGDAPAPMFDVPPKAWLHRQGNFITSFFPSGLTPGEDYDWFYFPPIDEQYGKPVLVGGDIMAMFNDRPEVRAVMEFFTTGESLKTWIQSGGTIAPMNDADLDWYSNESDRRMAQLLQEATTIRFDGSDQMPGSVGAGTFWKGMTDYVSGTVDLDEAMEEIQAGFNQ